jgi:phosphoribosylanthranilate isomerase
VRPHVKVCGVTRREDADAAIALGAEFIGINFYAGSPRHVAVADAARLRRHIGDRARVVGVFVDRGTAEVTRIAETVGLDLLQFHGHEEPADLEPHGERAIKVFRVAGELPYVEIARYATAWGFLFDTARGAAAIAGGGAATSEVAGEPRDDHRRFGGTGTNWSWQTAGPLPTGRPVFVAGGVKPDNVAELLARLSPWGIDVSSGVESAPGRKDPVLLERLFEEIAHAQTTGAS